MTIINDGAACDLPPPYACISIDDVLTYPSCCSFIEGLCCNSTVLENNIIKAIELIEAVSQLSICPYDECKRFDGHGDCKLYFTPETSDKLIELITVKYSSCHPCQTVPTIDPENFGTWLEYCDNIFPCGSNNIEICGHWGSFTTIPENIKKAVVYLTLELSQPGITGIVSSSGTVDSVTWDDFSITYNTSGIDLTEITTGFAEIDRMVMAFVPTRSRIKMSIIDKKCKDCCTRHNKQGCQQEGCTQC